MRAKPPSTTTTEILTRTFKDRRRSLHKLKLFWAYGTVTRSLRDYLLIRTVVFIHIRRAIVQRMRSGVDTVRNGLIQLRLPYSSLHCDQCYESTVACGYRVLRGSCQTTTSTHTSWTYYISVPVLQSRTQCLPTHPFCLQFTEGIHQGIALDVPTAVFLVVNTWKLFGSGLPPLKKEPPITNLLVTIRVLPTCNIGVLPAGNARKKLVACGSPSVYHVGYRLLRLSTHTSAQLV